MPEFTKYREQGDYHWREFQQDCVYRDHVLKVVGWVKGEKILDIGCGDGLITSKIGAKGIDTSEEGIRLAQKHGVPCEVMSAYDVKGDYDAVFLGDTLEHLESPESAINAIGGITSVVYIVVPTESDSDDCTEWNKNSLRVFMQNLGWQEEYSDVANFRIYGKFTHGNLHVLRPKKKVARNPKRKTPANKSSNRGRLLKRTPRKAKRS